MKALNLYGVEQQNVDKAAPKLKHKKKYKTLIQHCHSNELMSHNCNYT